MRIDKKKSQINRHHYIKLYTMSSYTLTHLIPLGIISFLTGYYARDYLKKQRAHTKVTKAPQSESESEYEESSEDEGIDVDSRELNEIPGPVKMALVIQQGLKMTKGKAAAQCLHATLGLYRKISNPYSEAYNPEMLKRWEYENGQAKITLQVPNKEEMDMLYAKAISLGVNCYMVIDAGRTQVDPGSATVLGLGPAPKLVLDQITGDLRLY